MGIEIPINLPQPHSKQLDFIRSPAKRKCICAGRRGGKTTGSSILAAEQALAGHRVLDAAPTIDQTEAFWDACKRYFAEAIERGYVKKNETKRTLDLPNDGRIRAKTAWDADSLRGDYADLLILEEYSLQHPNIWDEVGSPMLLDNDGDAVFIFTPKRRNHAHAMYQRAVTDTTGRWQAWHFTSHDNPYLSAAALAEITHDMSADAYQQEIMAEFLESQGAVFRNIMASLTAPATTPEAHRAHRIVMGVDWGKQNDFTVLDIGCADCGCEVEMQRFNQIDYHFQRGKLGAAVTRWGVSEILAESNSIGEPNIEELQRSGLPVLAFQTTATTKPPLIEALALDFDRQGFVFLNDPIGRAELEAYERTVSATTGRPSYSAPEGVHDDTVMGRALMRWQMTRASGWSAWAESQLKQMETASAN